MHSHFKSIRISFISLINKVTRDDKAMIVANDTSLCGAILVLFLEFRPGNRAEISHKNSLLAKDIARAQILDQTRSQFQLICSSKAMKDWGEMM